MKPTSILLVEDNLPDARYVREILPKTTYSVVYAVSLCEAHKELEKAEFDIILLDLSLPDGTGLDTINAMVKASPSTPIIVLTGLDDEQLAIRAVHLGAQDYLLKRDIAELMLTRTIRYAIERKQFEKKAQRLSVLEQREEFMATLTHDLKNPLIGANRILELMAFDEIGPITPQQSKLLLQLRDSNQMLLSMIQNLIEVYKFEQDVHTVTIVNTNIHNIVISCLSDIALLADHRDIKIETDLSDDVRDIPADPTAIRRVVQNLLDNALKFTPSGGRISLAVHPFDHQVCVEIEDTGPGIPREEQKQLFQRFNQGRVGRKYTPGTGLGLYLCKRIVDAHKGQIQCNSEEGGGTIFRVILPAV